MPITAAAAARLLAWKWTLDSENPLDLHSLGVWKKGTGVSRVDSPIPHDSFKYSTRKRQNYLRPMWSRWCFCYIDINTPTEGQLHNCNYFSILWCLQVKIWWFWQTDFSQTPQEMCWKLIKPFSCMCPLKAHISSLVFAHHECPHLSELLVYSCFYNIENRKKKTNHPYIYKIN